MATKPETKRYHASVLLNLTSRFHEALPERDLFVSLAETTSFVVDALDFTSAAEAMYAIGNRQSKDLNGKEWSTDVRSMSTGDIVILHEEQGRGTYLACQGTGWKDVTDYVLNWISATELAYQLADRFNAASVKYEA